MCALLLSLHSKLQTEETEENISQNPEKKQGERRGPACPETRRVHDSQSKDKRNRPTAISYINDNKEDYGSDSEAEGGTV